MEKHSLFRVVKISKAVWKGTVSQTTLRKGLFSQKIGTHCLASFRRMFAQVSVPSIPLGPRHMC